MTTADEKPPCVLLAGGLSRRMGGGAKFLQELDGKSLLSRIYETIRPQVGPVILNINLEDPGLAGLDIPVVPDTVKGFAGPLAGILTGLEYFIEKEQKSSHMLSLPTDAPFIPADLVARLAGGLTGAPNEIVMAESLGRVHPVVALWPLSIAADLRKALVEEGLRKILVFADRYPRVNVVWKEGEGDPFYNINRPGDLAEAEQRLRSEAGLGS